VNKGMMDGEKITFRGEGDQQVCFITINRPLREEMFAGHFNFVDLLYIYIFFFFLNRFILQNLSKFVIKILTGI